MAAGSGEPVVDYTSLDYTSALADLVRYAEAQCGLPVGSLPPTDFGVVLTKVVAYATDLLAYNVHQLVAEAFTVLCSRVSNFAKAARAAGYTMHGPVAAVVPLTITVDLGAGPPASATISRHDKYGTEDGVIFQPDADTVVGPGLGVTTVVVDATEGDEIQNEALASSTGAAGQAYRLAGSPLLQDTLDVTVSSVSWTRASSDVLALSEATDNHYALRVADDGSVTVTFGDGVNGKIPPAAAPIRATYKVGGGYAGNVETGAVSRRVLTASPLVTVVTNASRGQGGAPSQSLANAQATLPGFTRANDRAVNEDDYGPVVVAYVPGIAKARGELVGRDIVVHCCPNGGSSGSLNSTLVSQVQAALRPRRMSGRRILVREATYGELAVTADVYVLSSHRAVDVRVRVATEIAAMYDFDLLDFGVTLDLQTLYRRIGPESLAGVSRVVVRRHTMLPYQSTYTAFPPTGTGRPESIEIRDTVLRREWMVTVTASLGAGTRGSFTVTERYVGRVTSLSDVTMGDEATNLGTNAVTVVGAPFWYLRLNPYASGSSPRQIVGNTQTSVTVISGDLRTLGQPGDDYVIEKVQPDVGVIYRDTIAGATAAAAPTLNLPGTWLPGDEIRVEDPLGVVFRATITGGVAGAYTVNAPIPALAGGADVDAVWVADNGSVEFALVLGAVNFTAGDVMFVDTFAHVDDIGVRPLVYPELVEENLTVRTIGGRS